MYNKIDVCSIEEVDAIARMDYSIPVSAFQELNMDGLLERMWEMMALVRVYTKKVRGLKYLCKPAVEPVFCYSATAAALLLLGVRAIC